VCHWRRSPSNKTTFESTELTKEEQRKILQAELIEIDAEKRKIEKRLKKLESSESRNEN
jgi:alkylated DNA nucleotide flippase Atl1